MPQPVDIELERAETEHENDGEDQDRSAHGRNSATTTFLPPVAEATRVAAFLPAAVGPATFHLMRIVSLNAWGGAMYDDLLPWLRTDPADVLCLQEVTRTPGLAGWTAFADAERTLPQRADLLADVAGALPHHQPLFVASDTGPVTGDDGIRREQDFGIATFVAVGLTLTGVASHPVHGAYARHQEWPHTHRPRTALAVQVAEPSGRTVGVIQVHGLRDAAGKGDSPARREQAERLAALAGRIRAYADLTVLCGDLNLLPDSETFAILADAGMTDLVRDADTRTSRYTKPVRHASYLLVSDPSAVRSFEIVTGPEVSDHRALALEV